MRTSDKIFEAVDRLIATEVLATADFRETRSSDADRQILEARSDLLPLLHEASRLRDIDLLLQIERAFLQWELDHIAYERNNISSLNIGIEQIDAAITMLGHVRNPDAYRWAGIFYTLSKDLIRDLPEDAAHKFFASHKTRLLNTKRGRMERNETALINIRTDNINRAKELYIELQQQALAIPEVREPSVPYAPERKLKLVA